MADIPSFLDLHRKAELEQVRADAEALEVAIKDLLFAMQVDPSCQLGVVERCRCFFCASSRAKSAQGKGGAQNGSKVAETRASAGLEGGGHGENYGGAENGLQTAETPEIDGAEGGAE